MTTKAKPLPVWSVQFRGDLLIAAANADDAAQIAQDEIMEAVGEWTPHIVEVGVDDGGADVIRR